jgi:hypothetical protein
MDWLRLTLYVAATTKANCREKVRRVEHGGPGAANGGRGGAEMKTDAGNHWSATPLNRWLLLFTLFIYLFIYC